MFKFLLSVRDPREQIMHSSPDRLPVHQASSGNLQTNGVAAARVRALVYRRLWKQQSHRWILFTVQELRIQNELALLKSLELGSRYGERQVVDDNEDLISSYYRNLIVGTSLKMDEQRTFDEFVSGVLHSVRSPRSHNDAFQARVWNFLDQFQARFRFFAECGLPLVSTGSLDDLIVDSDHLVWLTYRRMSPPERELLATTFDRYGGWFAITLFLINELHEALERAESVQLEPDNLHEPFFWPLRFAALCDVDVEFGDYAELPAFMIETQARTLICIDQQLPSEVSSFAICHELAHRLFLHAANSEYGLDTALLTPARAEVFERQEREADGVATVMVHLAAELNTYLLHATQVNAVAIDSPDAERAGNRFECFAA